MTDVYEVFKMIFGIVASVFILYFIIYFGGSYSNLQEMSIKADIMKNFRTTAQDVLFSGNPIGFKDFGAKDFDLTYDPSRTPAILRSQGGDMEINFPLFFVPGDNVYISRGSLDYGFWNFGFIEAAPSMRIIFNPLDTSAEAWQLIRDMVNLMPETTGQETKMEFALLAGGSAYGCWEKFDFLSKMNNAPDSIPTCAGTSFETRTITLAGSCSGAGGICAETGSSGAGRIYIDGSSFLYSDALDVVAAALGGTVRDDFGKSAGEKFLLYKQKLFGSWLLAASRAEGQRDIMISREYNSTSECLSPYDSSRQKMDAIGLIVSDSSYYQQQAKLLGLNGLLSEAKEIYSQLVLNGCEEGVPFGGQ